MPKHIRVCDSRCHNGKNDPKTCKCFCGGHFHGAAGMVNREALYNIKDDTEKLIYLGEHGFLHGETKYKEQIRMDIQDNGKFNLFPPSADTCQICACKHDDHTPHNRDSLYYQSRFMIQNKRLPTWLDAMAHCDKETRIVWTKTLTDMGVKVGE